MASAVAAATDPKAISNEGNTSPSPDFTSCARTTTNTKNGTTHKPSRYTATSKLSRCATKYLATSSAGLAALGGRPGKIFAAVSIATTTQPPAAPNLSTPVF